ncbi:MAG: BON domain-containing protein [Burkholderiales bacterium]
MNKPILTMTAAAVLAAFTLAGCSKTDTSASAKDMANQTEQKAKEIGAEASQQASKGMAEVKEATRDLAQDAKQAGNEVADKVSDAVITTSVKAELVKDPDLSALKINVDTAGGRVVLQGSAPSPAARDQAVRLAQGVKGVVSVDNQLKVEPGKG